MIGDGQGVAVPAIAELELALEVGAPQIVGKRPLRQRRAARAMARPASTLDQAMAVKHRVDGALGRNLDVSVEPAHQQFADLARTPVRLLGLEADDKGLDLLRELVGIAHRPSGAVAERLQAVFLVAIENLVAGLARYAELPADLGHGFPFQKPGDKAKALLHYRTRFPRHLHLPQNKSGMCNPCVRYVLSPMSRAAPCFRLDSPRDAGMGRKTPGFSRIRFRLWTPCLPNLRWKSPKVSGLVREYSRFAETIGGDWFDQTAARGRHPDFAH